MQYWKWILFTGVLFLSACNSSKITTSYIRQDYSYKEFKKVLVIALIKDKDRSIQAKMENHLAADFRDLGYTAVTSLQDYGPKAFENLTEQEVLKKINTSGIDAVCTIVLLDKKKEKEYIAPKTYYAKDFWDYYDIRYKRIYEPGYFITNTRYFWESNFYDLSTKSLVYSAQTQSFSPESTELLGHTYGKLIINHMLKKRILKQHSIPEE